MGLITLTTNFIAAQQNPKKTVEAIKKIQERKLRNMLHFAYANSNFYHQIYSNAGISKNDLDTIAIEDLPIIDKTIVMDNFDEIITNKKIKIMDLLNFLEQRPHPETLYKNRFHVVHTSGSSGNIGVFVYDQIDWDRFFPYSTRLFPFRFRKNRTAFFGAVDGHYIGVSFNTWLGKGITKLFVEPLILDITKPLSDALDQLNSFQPTILGGYFTGLKILAEQQEAGHLTIHPNHIVSCGEGIIPHDKSYIESVFNAPLSNLYGLAECPFLGAGKNEYNGIYLMDDIAYIEIMDDHVLLTNLFNFTQPLIRYKISDFFVKKHDKQKILPFTLIDDIVGRAEAMVWLENDQGTMDFIHPIVFAEFYVKGLNRLQIHIKNKKQFVFFAEIHDEEVSVVKDKIAEKLDHLLGEKGFTQVSYDIEFVEKLDVDPHTGKFRLVITPD